VLHGYIGEKIDSPDAVKALVKTIVHTYKLPYFTITPTFSVCPIHGYLAGEYKYCPKCDEEHGYHEGDDEVDVSEEDAASE
jgi:ribonucleoside-triphosphate reductase